MIAPSTIPALGEVAAALGFELVAARMVDVRSAGVDAELTDGKLSMYRLVDRRRGEPAFEGTARECAAYLIGRRDLASRVRDVVVAEIGDPPRDGARGVAPCSAFDGDGRRCVQRAGHAGPHANLQTWTEPAWAKGTP